MADHFDEPGTSSPMESIEELKEEIMEKHDEYLEQVSDDPELADEEKKKISHLFKRRCVSFSLFNSIFLFFLLL